MTSFEALYPESGCRPLSGVSRRWVAIVAQGRSRAPLTWLLRRVRRRRGGRHFAGRIPEWRSVLFFGEQKSPCSVSTPPAHGAVDERRCRIALSFEVHPKDTSPPGASGQHRRAELAICSDECAEAFRGEVRVGRKDLLASRIKRRKRHRHLHCARGSGLEEQHEAGGQRQSRQSLHCHSRPAIVADREDAYRRRTAVLSRALPLHVFLPNAIKKSGHLAASSGRLSVLEWGTGPSPPSFGAGRERAPLRGRRSRTGVAKNGSQAGGRRVGESL